jgi:DNA-binding transcriptional regulator YiaG
MNTEECNNCGKAAKVTRGEWEFEEFGLPVKLINIKLIKCGHCGNVDPIIPNMNGLMTAIALKLVCSQSLLGGEEIRFLRKYVGKSAQEFARLLHTDHTHLSKLENNRLEIGHTLDKYLRLLVSNLSPDLRDNISQLIEQLPGMSDSCDDNKPEIRIDPSAPQHACA